MNLQAPYLLFLGDAKDQLAAKTAQGIKDWRPEKCVGQLRLWDCKATLGLQDMTLQEAWDKGARTLVIGVATRGGKISAEWHDCIMEALDIGYHVASGLHARLTQIADVSKKAADKGLDLFDVRHADGTFECGSGEKRSGKRVLAVGTDCSVGKMYATLAMECAMLARGMKATFRATGQTGIFIAGSGVSVDAVVSDFISGAVEQIAPANDPDHWDLIEGQGSLFHPSFAGVSMGLLHGAQADALIMCHEPTRKTMRGVDYPLPSIEDCMDLNLRCARLTNPNAKFIGLAVNTSALSEAEATTYLQELSDQFGLPAVDPVRTGVDALVDALASC
ncbi:N-acetyltransferase DgcN [Kordiimonas sediminis]|uniref:N-acetyltransferase DgcN n=1 Tax=Kordiimonas sediminis TaxID=1735581 RepID=UPI00174825AF